MVPAPSTGEGNWEQRPLSINTQGSVLRTPSQLGSQPAMRIYYLLFAYLFLFMLPVPGNGGIISGLQKYYCKRRSGRCLPKEEQIGRCSRVAEHAARRRN
ncbi:unnamed protein product, partial [Rangifer tarandus platyrhynchus]